MLWNASNEDIDFQGLRQNTRLMVFAEDAETVFGTLLVRPADKLTAWTAAPDLLDLSRVDELTLVGQMEETCLPAQSRTGHWGMRAQSFNDGGKGLKRFIYQLNANPAIIDHFANVGTGTLVWVSDRADLVNSQDAALHSMWVAAPVSNFLPLTPTANYKLGDPLAVTFEDITVLNAAPDGISDTVILTDQLSAQLADALPAISAAHPYVDPNAAVEPEEPVDETPEEPVDETPEEPVDETPEEPADSGSVPEEPVEGDGTGTGTGTSEEPVDETPEEPADSGSAPEEPAEGDGTSTSEEPVDETPEEPVDGGASA